MAYYEALEAAVDQDVVFMHKTVPDLIASILVEMPDTVLQQLSDCAEIADTSDRHYRHLIDKAAMEAGKIIFSEIHTYLAENYPTAWGDEGDLSEHEERLRLDRKERTRDMQLESARMGSYAAMSQKYKR